VARHAHWLDKLKIPNAGFVVALIVMLGMAALSEAIGLAGIVGAFFAGMMFAETEDRWELTRQAKPLYEWLVPYFFVVTGMQVQPSLFSDPKVLVPGLVLVAIAIATKVIGCGLGAAGMGWKRMVAIGIGMVPRGEVGLIVASTGLAMGVIGSASYAMIIMVVVASTVVVPPLLAVVFPWAMAEPIDAAAEALAEAPVMAIVSGESGA
jgi:Kef-type K+ transport system membrane component KefB